MVLLTTLWGIVSTKQNRDPNKTQGKCTERDKTQRIVLRIQSRWKSRIPYSIHMALEKLPKLKDQDSGAQP